MLLSLGNMLPIGVVVSTVVMVRATSSAGEIRQLHGAHEPSGATRVAMTDADA